MSILNNPLPRIISACLASFPAIVSTTLAIFGVLAIGKVMLIPLVISCGGIYAAFEHPNLKGLGIAILSSIPYILLSAFLLFIGVASSS